MRSPWLADPITDVFHPNSIRSSTGTVFSVPLATGSSAQVQQWLRENRFLVFTALLENATDFFEMDLTGNIALVLGNEANGLDDQWNQRDYRPVKLPMQGQADSRAEIGSETLGSSAAGSAPIRNSWSPMKSSRRSRVVLEITFMIRSTASSEIMNGATAKAINRFAKRAAKDGLVARDIGEFLRYSGVQVVDR